MLKQLVLTIVVCYPCHDDIDLVNELNSGGMDSYGCPECHATSISCHVDWQRPKLDESKKLWMISFHTTLMKDTFGYCLVFFREGRCMNCHPGILKPPTMRKGYLGGLRNLKLSSAESTIVNISRPLSGERNPGKLMGGHVAEN